MNPPHPSLLQSLRALPRTAWILFFGTFLNKFGTFVMPFLTLYLTGRGFSLAQTGTAVGAYGAGYFVASFLGGYLSDRIGRRNTIALSMFSGAGAMLLLSQARTFPALVGLTFLAGLTSELYRPASSALLGDLTPPGQRLTAFSAYRVAFNAGWAFGPATAGFLAAHSYSWLFWGNALTSALYGVVALALLPHGVRARRNESGWGPALRALRRDAPFQQTLLASLATGFVFFQIATTLGLAMTNRGFSPSTYGAVLSLNGVLIVLFELPTITFTRRFPARRVMAVGFILIALGFSLNAFARTAGELRLCMALFTLGEMIAMPVSIAYTADLCPPEMRGRYMGAFGLTWAISMTLAPVIGMRLFGIAPALLWAAGAVAGVTAAAVISVKVESRSPVPSDAPEPARLAS